MIVTGDIRKARGYPAIHVTTLVPHDLHQCLEPGYAGTLFNEDLLLDHVAGIREGFSGVKNRAEAERFLDEGWPHGARELATLAAEVEDSVPMAAQIRRKMRWSDDGDEIDLQRVYSGHLDSSWRDMTRSVRVQSRVLQVVTRWGENADASQKRLFWQGAAGAVLCDVLERAGYRVELAGCLAAMQGNGLALTYMKVKEAQQPMNLDSVAASLCKGSTFRVFGIASLANFPRDVNYGWGYAQPSVEKYLEIAAKHGLVDAPDIVLERVTNKSSAIHAIRGGIEQVEAKTGFGVSEAWESDR
jgi:hypothetical protein